MTIHVQGISPSMKYPSPVNIIAAPITTTQLRSFLNRLRATMGPIPVPMPRAAKTKPIAAEWLLVMGVEALSILLASLVLEMGLFSLRSTVLGFAIASTLIGLFWAIRAIPAEKSDYREGKVPEA